MKIKVTTQIAIGSLSILLAGTIVSTASAIIKSEVNEVNILNIYRSLTKIESHLLRIESKLGK